MYRGSPFYRFHDARLIGVMRLAGGGADRSCKTCGRPFEPGKSFCTAAGWICSECSKRETAKAAAEPVNA